MKVHAHFEGELNGKYIFKNSPSSESWGPKVMQTRLKASLDVIKMKGDSPHESELVIVLIFAFYS